MKEFTVAASFILLVLGVAHLGGCSSEESGPSDCGSNACGACQSGYTNVDVCRDGEWDCTCVPLADAAVDASTRGADASSSCSSSPCGACAPGYTNVEVCKDGTWDCKCVPEDGGTD